MKTKYSFHILNIIIIWARLQSEMLDLVEEIKPIFCFKKDTLGLKNKNLVLE